MRFDVVVAAELNFLTSFSLRQPLLKGLFAARKKRWQASDVIWAPYTGRMAQVKG